MKAQVEQVQAVEAKAWRGTNGAHWHDDEESVELNDRAVARNALCNKKGTNRRADCYRFRVSQSSQYAQPSGLTTPPSWQRLKTGHWPQGVSVNAFGRPLSTSGVTDR